MSAACVPDVRAIEHNQAGRRPLWHVHVQHQQPSPLVLDPKDRDRTADPRCLVGVEDRIADPALQREVGAARLGPLAGLGHRALRDGEHHLGSLVS